MHRPLFWQGGSHVAGDVGRDGALGNIGELKNGKLEGIDNDSDSSSDVAGHVAAGCYHI